MKLKGNTYKKRVKHQLIEWVKGNSIHNEKDNECCPDFSCCKPNLLQPEEIRKTFYTLSELGDKEMKEWEKDNSIETPNYDKAHSMLGGFLCSGLDEIDPNKSIHVVGSSFNKSKLN
ncbi:hypothetical protein ACQY1Q_05975 [Tenacibaculum sp. TC6]|uniref:hypothetical protein n=1 Tax=Tenacibaculum sp. TC6 TaxID=3423223 RepID=UPI003D361FCF